MVRNHYNQQERLRHFARHEGNHDKLTLVDLKKKDIGSRNVKTSFYEEGLYSDELERELNVKIEAPGMMIFNKVYNSNYILMLTRSEIEIVKKYILIQCYRNPVNISRYDPEWPGDTLHFNQIYKNGDESFKEHVYRMMHIILDHSWDELCDCEEEEIRDNARRILGTMTLFVRSGFEFVINDIGLVTERQEWNRLAENDEMKRILRTSICSLGISPTDEEFESFIDSHRWYDNFIFIPISSNFGIVALGPLWTELIRMKNPYKYSLDDSKLYATVDDDFFKYVYEKHGLHSKFIQDNFAPCINAYQSEALSNASSIGELRQLIAQHKDPNDAYYYPVVDLEMGWALYLNNLTINEADKYFAFGSIIDGRITIDHYEMTRVFDDNKGYKQNLEWTQTIEDWTKPLS